MLVFSDRLLHEMGTLLDMRIKEWREEAQREGMQAGIEQGVAQGFEQGLARGLRG